VRTLLALYALALAARLALVVAFPDPAYPDSAYYVNVARELAAGRGFTTDVVWIFAEVGGRIPADPVLPIPSNAHWAPLASIVQVPFIWLLGPTAFASALPFALVGALAAPLAFLIGRDAGASVQVSVAAGVLTALPSLVFVWMAQPDNFALFQVLTAGSLWLAARGLRGRPRDFALAGLLAGLATVSRTEGLLVLLVLLGLAVGDRLATARSARRDGPRAPRIPARATGAAVGLFALVLAPWWLRQLAVFGTVSPSTASGKVLFMRDFSEWNSITVPAGLDHLLGMGLGPLLATRIDGLVAALFIFGVLVCGLVLVPFLLIGGWRRRRSLAFTPWFLFALLLLAFSATLAAIHVPGGQFIHSAVALVPHAYVLAAEGVAAVALWIAARRPSWNPDRAAGSFLAIAVAIAAGSSVLGAVQVHDGWDVKRDRRQMTAEALAAAGAVPADRLMSIDAAAFKYWTGHAGVVAVDDPIETIEDVARAYDIRWLVLERDEIVEALQGVLLRDERPAWIGREVFRGGEGTRELALYPVCTTDDDTRCAE
jgi:hypothetical protein